METSGEPTLSIRAENVSRQTEFMDVSRVSARRNDRKTAQKSRMFWRRQRSMDFLRTPNRSLPVEGRIVDGIACAENRSNRRELDIFRLPLLKTRPLPDLTETYPQAAEI